VKAVHCTQETEYLDISLIRDARTGKYARLPKVTNQHVFMYVMCVIWQQRS